MYTGIPLHNQFMVLDTQFHEELHVLHYKPTYLTETEREKLNYTER